jgi:DNA primase
MNLKSLKIELNNRIEDILSKLGIEYEVLGDNIYCCCPIHEESDNPRAFSFSKNKGIWKCWTRDCQHNYKNDVFGIIQGNLSRTNGIDATFSDVLKWCNQFVNTGKITYNKEKTEEDSDFTQLVKKISHRDDVLDDYKELILTEQIITPSEYFIQRGFKKSTLKHFGVGDCCDKTSKLYDRSIIPIHNDDGTKLIGCTARAIKEYKTPKFLLYPKGFDKRYFLYNHHRAIKSVNETGTLFIVEGQSDVWRLYESGIKQAVGVFGRTLSKEQETKINRMPVTHIVVLLDNDQAGRESKIQLQRQLNRMYKLSFPKIPTKDIGELNVDQIKKILFPQLKGIKI